MKKRKKSSRSTLRQRGSGRRSQSKPASEGKTERHPLFGDVPLIWMPYGADGGYACWAYDPEYRPPLPPGAVEGDVSKQVYCRLCHSPRYFYVDEKKTCVQCGRDFVFSAQEQKHWYESLHFHFDSTAIRCVECRSKKRSDRAVQARLNEAARRLKENGDDPEVLVDYARAVVDHRAFRGQGDVAAAIRACRKAREVSPTMLDAWYWEGRCNQLAGRDAKGREMLGRFTELAGDDSRYDRLVRNAKELMQGGSVRP